MLDIRIILRVSLITFLSLFVTHKTVLAAAGSSSLLAKTIRSIGAQPNILQGRSIDNPQKLRDFAAALIKVTPRSYQLAEAQKSATLSAELRRLGGIQRYQDINSVGDLSSFARNPETWGTARPAQDLLEFSSVPPISSSSSSSPIPSSSSSSSGSSSSSTSESSRDAIRTIDIPVNIERSANNRKQALSSIFYATTLLHAPHPLNTPQALRELNNFCSRLEDNEHFIADGPITVNEMSAYCNDTDAFKNRVFVVEASGADQEIGLYTALRRNTVFCTNESDKNVIRAANAFQTNRINSITLLVTDADSWITAQIIRQSNGEIELTIADCNGNSRNLAQQAASYIVHRRIPELAQQVAVIDRLTTMPAGQCQSGDLYAFEIYQQQKNVAIDDYLESGNFDDVQTYRATFKTRLSYIPEIVRFKNDSHRDQLKLVLIHQLSNGEVNIKFLMTIFKDPAGNLQIIFNEKEATERDIERITRAINHPNLQRLAQLLDTTVTEQDSSVSAATPINEGYRYQIYNYSDGTLRENYFNPFNIHVRLTDYDAIKNYFRENHIPQLTFNDRENIIEFPYDCSETNALLLMSPLNNRIRLLMHPLNIKEPQRNQRMRPGVEITEENRNFMRPLLQDAERYLSSKNARQIELAPEKNYTHQNILAELLIEYEGICIGEVHGDMSPKKTIIDNLDRLKALGLTTLYLEHFFYDSSSCNMLNNPDPLPNFLSSAINRVDVGFNIRNRNYGFKALIKAARRKSIRIIPIDTTVSYVCGVTIDAGASADPRSRYTAMNYVADRIIRATRDGGKYIALMGSGHAVTGNEGVIGVAELLGCPSIVISDSDRDKLTLNKKDFARKKSGGRQFLTHVSASLKVNSDSIPKPDPVQPEPTRSAAPSSSSSSSLPPVSSTPSPASSSSSSSSRISEADRLIAREIQNSLMSGGEAGARLASQRLNGLAAEQRDQVRRCLIHEIGFNSSFTSRFQDKNKLFTTGFSDATIQEILAAHSPSGNTSTGATPSSSSSSNSSSPSSSSRPTLDINILVNPQSLSDQDLITVHSNLVAQLQDQASNNQNPTITQEQNYLNCFREMQERRERAIDKTIWERALLSPTRDDLFTTYFSDENFTDARNTINNPW